MLGAVFIASSFLVLALSFTLSDSDGRPILFSVALAVSLVCLWQAHHRLALVVAFVAMLALRILWGFIMY